MVKPISLRLRNAEIRARAEATLIRSGRADDVKRAHTARVMREARATVERAKEQKRLKAVAALAAHKAILAVREAYFRQDKVDATEFSSRQGRDADRAARAAKETRDPNMNARRLLQPHIDAYRRALAEAKADLSVMNFQHQCRQADLLRQVEELRGELEALKDIVRRRVAAERELANLRALRAAERDPTRPLQ